MRTRHLIPLLLAAPLSVGILTACDTTSSLTQLRHVLPEGGPYEVALSGMYRDYAEAELAAYDWWSSKRFADKGLYVAEGKPVAPENPADWAIPLGARPELDRARDALVNALSGPGKAAHPQAAASAQFHYDCWVENTDEGWQSDDIASCRDRFYTSLATLQAPNETTIETPPLPSGEGRGLSTEASAQVDEGSPQSPAPIEAPISTSQSPSPHNGPASDANLDNSSPHRGPASLASPDGSSPRRGEDGRGASHPVPSPTEQPPTTASLPEVTSSMVLYFPFDDAILESQMLPEVEGLIASLKANPTMQLVINGHADRAGTDQYNLDLSARRADYMRKLLIENGISPDRVTYYAFGESDPAVETPDGQPLRANRRVEIFLE